jgi:hypothetical protein
MVTLSPPSRTRSVRPTSSRRIHHFHIRKTAGTSLNAAFWALGGVTLKSFGTSDIAEGNGLVFARRDPVLLSREDIFFSNAHLPAYDVSLPADTFTVTFLRDPVQRVVSHYRYLLWAKNESGRADSEPYISDLQEEISWLGSTFVDFLRNLPKAHLLHQLRMFSSGYDVEEASGQILKCSLVGFTETFSSDLRRLSGILSLRLVELYERRFNNTCAIDPHDLGVARTMLGAEYRLLRLVKMRLGLI